MILHYSFHTPRGTGQNVQCETSAVTAVLREEVRYMNKMYFQPIRLIFPL